ncbi:acetyl-CoA carboxylase biotin carboxylase subunit family protein [Reinekea sp. G2M2-21]|uniref:ATP-grasp domain-containing protein n=1 Tax=Reinekea sp. G2M2-21 TaxID=2788942 RepID=UPI0018A95C3A|nr:ATP-grasp domain-containing protein [Reinekea sp. G2M2-21]
MTAKTLVLLTHVVHNAVTQGFIPAAKKLGCRVVVLTDHAMEHQAYYSDHLASDLPDEIHDCDVFNSLSVLELLIRKKIKPDGVFSNSDHLQTQTSQIAHYFQLPGKDWRVCYQAKNKAATRERMLEAGLPTIWHASLSTIEELDEATVAFPCVVKPQEGVASMHVKLCYQLEELSDFCQTFWHQHPGQMLLLEEYMPGPLFTLETLGDGENLFALGGFDTALSQPPYFIELECIWNNDKNCAHLQEAFEQVKAFGVGFGACHSEFVLTEQGPRLVEINYRSIGDGCEFLLDKMAPFNWFEEILRRYLNEPLTSLAEITGCALTRFFVAEKSGLLTRQPSDFVENAPCYLKLENLKTTGTRHQLENSNRDYLAVLSAVGENRDSLLKTVNERAESWQWEIQA